MRIAIIGGTFDPIHDGHIAMAKHVIRQHLCDEVWFMVAKDTPLKARVLSRFEDRFAMCKIAIAPYKAMRVSDLEAQLAGVSFTIHTVEELRRQFPQHSFVWLIGADQAAQLERWKQIDELCKLISFYVFPRGVEEVHCKYPMIVMKKELVDVSSSEIRRGKKRYYLDKNVTQYIAKQGLYVEEFAQQAMGEKRYGHSASVAKLCVHLALLHGVDERKAYIAGILHDVCKEWKMKASQQWMSNLHPDLMSESPSIWHAYIASSYVPHALRIMDSEILHAIFHHVKGSRKHKLSMILYISDKLDPQRGYDSFDTIALCERDLEAGYEEVKRQQMRYLKKENVIHE